MYAPSAAGQGNKCPATQAGAFAFLATHLGAAVGAAYSISNRAPGAFRHRRPFSSGSRRRDRHMRGSANCSSAHRLDQRSVRAFAPTGRLVLGTMLTTKNRLWQLQTALPLNILAVWPHRDSCRIHLAVCDNTDETMSCYRYMCYSHGGRCPPGV